MAKSPTTEEQLKDFYNQQGWRDDQKGNSLDAQLWEDLRTCAKTYVSDCRKRILAHLPKQGGALLDAASGPIQYPEYLEFSRGFQKHYCVDVSATALEKARKRLGTKGEYFQASLLQLPFEPDFFDATISLHTIYHIDKKDQMKAVRELIRVTKSGANIVVIYANPDRPTHKWKKLIRPEKDQGVIYYHAYPLDWWKQFEDSCEVKIFPWRSLTANLSKKLIPDTDFGKKIFQTIFDFETRFPNLAVKLGAYPMIVMKKK